MKPDPQDHLVTLQYEKINSMGIKCSECDAEPKQLLIFYTVRGKQRRTHNGSFCSKRCHDIFHQLKPRVSK